MATSAIRLKIGNSACVQSAQAGKCELATWTLDPRLRWPLLADWKRALVALYVLASLLIPALQIMNCSTLVRFRLTSARASTCTGTKLKLLRMRAVVPCAAHRPRIVLMHAACARRAVRAQKSRELTNFVLQDRKNFRSKTQRSAPEKPDRAANTQTINKHDTSICQDTRSFREKSSRWHQPRSAVSRSRLQRQQQFQHPSQVSARARQQARRFQRASHCKCRQLRQLRQPAWANNQDCQRQRQQRQSQSPKKA